jgi:hypothetical protein
LQQEISNILAQLAQKHLEHFSRAQKINPDGGRGDPMSSRMMVHGMMHHGMMNCDESRQYHDAQIAPAENNTGASEEN